MQICFYKFIFQGFRHILIFKKCAYVKLSNGLILLCFNCYSININLCAFNLINNLQFVLLLIYISNCILVQN